MLQRVTNCLAELTLRGDRFSFLFQLGLKLLQYRLGFLLASALFVFRRVTFQPIFNTVPNKWMPLESLLLTVQKQLRVPMWCKRSINPI